MEVDVPKVKQVKDTAQELPVVTITRSGNLYLNDQMININDLGTQVRKKFHGASSVYLRADKDAIWDVIAQVVSALSEEKLGSTW